MPTRDTETVAGTSSGALFTPVNAGVGMNGLSSAARQILQNTEQNVLNTAPDKADFAIRPTVESLKSSILQSQSAKELAGLGALQSVGDLRNTILDNEMQRRQSEANSGFIGAGAALRGEQNFQRQIGASATNLENNYLQQLKQQNNNIGIFENSMADTLRGSEGMNKAIAEQLGLQSTEGLTQGLKWGNEEGNNWFTRMFGKDGTQYAELDPDQMSANPLTSSLIKELGLDTTKQETVDALNKALRGVISRDVSRNGMPAALSLVPGLGVAGFGAGALGSAFSDFGVRNRGNVKVTAPNIQKINV